MRVSACAALLGLLTVGIPASQTAAVLALPDASLSPTLMYDRDRSNETPYRGTGRRQMLGFVTTPTSFIL